MAGFKANSFTKTSLIALLLLFCMGFFSGLTAQGFGESEVIEVYGGTYGRLKIFLKVSGNSKADWGDLDEIDTSVEQSLKWSGLFDVARKKEYTDLSLLIFFSREAGFSALLVDSETRPMYHFKQKVASDAPLSTASMRLVEEIIAFLTGEANLFESAILYAKKTPQNGYELVICDSFGKRRTSVLQNREINILPRWRPDGRAFVYTTLTDQGSVLTELDLFLRQKRVILERTGTVGGGSWATDGKSLLVTLSQKGESDLYWIDREGKTRDRLTTRSSIESSPSLSPDGTRLLFVSDRSGSPQIYQRNLKTNRTFRMTFMGSYNVDPKWSPDSKWFVFSGIVEKNHQIFIMDRQGTRYRQITFGEESAEQPVWSPDGKQILYVNKKDFRQKLHLIRPDGTFDRRLTNSAEEVDEFNPSWVAGFDWRGFQNIE